MPRISAMIAICLAVLVCLVILYYTGLLRFNYSDSVKYPVRGFDISHHQGRIDWAALRKGNPAFVFIKATEGVSFRDPKFSENWANAKKYGIQRGAYHFFTFCDSGRAQFKNFLSAVPVGDSMLPPTVDVEFVGNCAKPPGLDAIRKELSVLLHLLEITYSHKPILYVAGSAYEEVVSGHYFGYPLWVRNIWREPQVSDGLSWTFWQYADRGRVPGISVFVDLNVFCSGSEDFYRFLQE